MSSRPTLLFVYNADSGVFNTLADIGHKIVSPSTYQCRLCALTHGYFSQHAAWRTFVESLPCTYRFLHRDEFIAEHPTAANALPAVFVDDKGTLRPLLTTQQLGRIENLAALQLAIRAECTKIIE